jgi:outer membrane lipoprotein
MKNFIIITVTLLLISACSMVPKELELPEETLLISFKQAKLSALDSQGNSARWGGVIASVTNQAKYSVIEVVNFDLNMNGRPQAKSETLGRFRVYFEGLIDPIIFQKGKSITAIGTIAASEQGKIGERSYEFPILMASNVYLWKPQKELKERLPASVYFDHYYNGYSRGYYSRPYYRHYRGVPPSNRIKQTKKVNKTK